MNWRNVDPSAWLLCTKWCADVMNLTAEKSLGWRTPLQVLTGQTSDISIALCFLFWDVVYVKRYKEKGYSGQIGSAKSSEIRGRMVGFSHDCGHHLTFLILTDDTKKIISRSQVRLAKDGENNVMLDAQAGDLPERFYIKSKHDSKEPDDVRLPTIDVSEDPFDLDALDPGEQQGSNEGETDTTPNPTGVDIPIVETVEEDEEEDDSGAHTPLDDTPLSDAPEVSPDKDDEDTPPHLRPKRKAGEPNPTGAPLDLDNEPMRTENPTFKVGEIPVEDMPGRTFLMPPDEDGSRVRAKIIKLVDGHRADAETDPDRIKFKCVVNDKCEEIVAYNQIVDYIEQDESFDGKWKFREILDHVEVKRSNNDGKDKYDKDYYHGCKWNVLVEWETGERTWQPLSTPRLPKEDRYGVWNNDPVTVLMCAAKHGLVEEWKGICHGIRNYTKTQKRMLRRSHQAKLHSHRHRPMHMFGVQVP